MGQGNISSVFVWGLLLSVKKTATLNGHQSTYLLF